jgi:hypothetical protein
MFDFRLPQPADGEFLRLSPIRRLGKAKRIEILEKENMLENVSIRNGRKVSALTYLENRIQLYSHGLKVSLGLTKLGRSLHR